jgi:hypothetical protein
VCIYRPKDHKVEHHGMDRVIPLGPDGRRVGGIIVRQGQGAGLSSEMLERVMRWAATP